MIRRDGARYVCELNDGPPVNRHRPSVAEFPNAVCRNQGLRQFLVRGLNKVRSVALWHALAFNIRRMMSLGVLT